MTGGFYSLGFERGAESALSSQRGCDRANANRLVDIRRLPDRLEHLKRRQVTHVVAVAQRACR